MVYLLLHAHAGGPGGANTRQGLLWLAGLCMVCVQEADKILDGAQQKDVSFLVVGDPFG